METLLYAWGQSKSVLHSQLSRTRSHGPNLLQEGEALCPASSLFLGEEMGINTVRIAAVQNHTGSDYFPSGLVPVCVSYLEVSADELNAASSL